MFRLLGTTFRFLITSLVIIVAANLLKIGNQSISDIVNAQVNKVTKSDTFQEWLSWSKQKLNHLASSVENKPQEIVNTQSSAQTPTVRSERQKLRDLLKRLNSAHHE